MHTPHTEHGHHLAVPELVGAHVPGADVGVVGGAHAAATHADGACAGTGDAAASGGCSGPANGRGHMAARLSRSAPCAWPKAPAHRPCRSRRRRRSCSRQQRCSCTRPADMCGHRARWAGAAGKECPPVQTDAFNARPRTQTQRPQEQRARVPTGVAGMRTGLHVMHAAGDGSRAPRSAHGWLAGRPVTLQRSWSTPQPSSPPTHRPSAHLPDGQMLPLQLRRVGVGVGWGPSTGGQHIEAQVQAGWPAHEQYECLPAKWHRAPATHQLPQFCRARGEKGHGWVKPGPGCGAGLATSKDGLHPRSQQTAEERCCGPPGCSGACPAPGMRPPGSPWGPALGWCTGRARHTPGGDPWGTRSRRRHTRALRRAGGPGGGRVSAEGSSTLELLLGMDGRAAGACACLARMPAPVRRAHKHMSWRGMAPTHTSRTSGHTCHCRGWEREEPSETSGVEKRAQGRLHSCACAAV